MGLLGPCARSWLSDKHRRWKKTSQRWVEAAFGGTISFMRASASWIGSLIVLAVEGMLNTLAQSKPYGARQLTILGTNERSGSSPTCNTATVGHRLKQGTTLITSRLIAKIPPNNEGNSPPLYTFGPLAQAVPCLLLHGVGSDNGNLASRRPQERVCPRLTGLCGRWIVKLWIWRKLVDPIQGTSSRWCGTWRCRVNVLLRRSNAWDTA